LGHLKKIDFGPIFGPKTSKSVVIPDFWPPQASCLAFFSPFSHFLLKKLFFFVGEIS
jgi:hypothetical protein